MATVSLIEIECGTCGVWHAIPRKMYETSQEEGGFWHCPNGHSRGWGTGTIQQERDRLKQKVAQLDDEVASLRRCQIEETELRLKTERKLVASKRRAAAGVCPCCTRTFANVQRHMTTKHPNVVQISQKEIA
jgi:hypothetical protein